MGKDSVFHCCGECYGLFGSKRVLADHKLACTGKPLQSACVMVAVERMDYKKYKHYVEVYGELEPAQIPLEPIADDPEQYVVSSVKLDKDVKVILIDPFKGKLKNVTAKMAPSISRSVNETQKETLSAIESIISNESVAPFDILPNSHSAIQPEIITDTRNIQKMHELRLTLKDVSDGTLEEVSKLTNISETNAENDNNNHGEDDDDDDDFIKGDGKKETSVEFSKGEHSGTTGELFGTSETKLTRNSQNNQGEICGFIDKSIHEADLDVGSKRQKAKQKGREKKKTKTTKGKGQKEGTNDEEIDPENQSWGAKQLAKYIAQAKEMGKLSDLELVEKYGNRSDGEKDLMKYDLLKCNHCDYSSAKRGHFLRHLRSHLTFHCELCGYETNQLRTVKLHIARHEKPHMCEFCPYKSGNLRDLERHRWTHTDVAPYHCDKCGYKCRQLKLLKEHKRKHTGEFLTCSYEGCTFSTPYRAAMESHKQRHTDIKHFVCNECAYRTGDRSSFNKHIKIHMNKKDYKCTQCSYRAVSRSSVSKHFQAVHEKMKLYQCDKCNYGSTTSSSLRIHLMSHMDMKPYMCSLCSYRSICKAKIQRHLNMTHKDKHGTVLVDSSVKLDEAMSKYRVPGTERRRVEVDRDFTEVVEEVDHNAHQDSTQQSQVISINNNNVPAFEYICGNCQMLFNSVESFTEHECQGLVGQIEGLTSIPDADEAVLVGTILSLGDVKYLPAK